MKNYNYKNQGLTLVELLLVISIIGILAGITVAVINPTKQRERAQDGVRISNLQSIASAIEAYYAGEGSYPADNAGGSLNPSVAPLSTYLSFWPGTGYVYHTFDDPTGTGRLFFCLQAPNASSTSYPIYKITAPYDRNLMGAQAKCGGVVLSCPSTQGCGDNSQGNDIGGCYLVSDGSSCGL